MILSVNPLFAQELVNSYLLDERHLQLPSGNSIVNDAAAHRGTANLRASSSNSGTFWFGPYQHFQAGNYLVHFRMKVASNLSDAGIVTLDASSPRAGVLSSVVLKPSMFRNSNEYQLITIPLRLPDDIDDLEIRGIGFIGGITDLYLDNITLAPGDPKGYYSNEFTIDNKGNVSVGSTDSKGYKLAIAGNMIAESIKVKSQGTWPDYVFAKEYKLPSLQEMERQIRAQGHLPGIPSADEVKANGMDLGKMNAKLLQKIEELTLYLIDVNRKVDVVTLENALLKQQLTNPVRSKTYK